MNQSDSVGRRVSWIGLSVLGLAVALVVTPMTEAASDDDAVMMLKARAVSTMNIERAASDLVDIKIVQFAFKKVGVYGQQPIMIGADSLEPGIGIAFFQFGYIDGRDQQ